MGSLEEALAQYTAYEVLDGENRYFCGRCKSYQKAKKKLMILEGPSILTVVLKRFQDCLVGWLGTGVGLYNWWISHCPWHNSKSGIFFWRFGQTSCVLSSTNYAWVWYCG
ncbi:Papain-like cysteine peptidase superfamily [Arabidopsis suecica]|uniref:Papain-like cysteine peptidase superfamily n=1 Tax=Arabidopsis suecica TaxID=45249 RepID=A0A8T2B8X3_ARASU|nr:Papain-like cysteine peptidase superfamily [Arabidopsis suecica]